MATEWDARTYDRVADPMARWGFAVLERLPLAGDETVLDAGCGSGRVTERLVEGLPRGHVVALDASRAMLDEARRRFGPRGLPVPLLLGVLPLVSARHAEFLHNEVPGITIPDEARQAMRVAGERGSEVGIEMADRLLRAVEGEVAGTYIMPSFGRYEQCAGLVRQLRARHAVGAR